MRRRIAGWIAAWMLLTAWMCPAALAEEAVYAVQLAEGTILVDARGNEIAGAGSYSALYELSGLPEGIYLYAGEAAHAPGAGYALVNAQGEALTDFIYQSLEYEEGKIVFHQDRRMGVLETDGTIYIEADYTNIAACGDGFYLAQKTDPYDDSPDALFLIDADGAEHESGVKVLNGITRLCEGMTPAVSAENGLYGYIGTNGGWAIHPAYEWAGDFADGRAAVRSARGAGLIDRAGKWIIEPKEYEHLSYAGGDIAVCFKNNQAYVMNAVNGEEIRRYSANSIYGYSTMNGTAVIVLNDRVVAIDGTGQEILDMEVSGTFNQWADMTDHAIIDNGAFGQAAAWLYRMDGTALAGPYQEIMPLGKKDGEMYYMYMRFDMEEVNYPDLGLSLWDEVPGTRKCGVLAPDGSELCEFSVEYLTYLGEDRMLIQQEGKAAMADFSGEIIKWFGGPEAQ